MLFVTLLPTTRYRRYCEKIKLEASAIFKEVKALWLLLAAACIIAIICDLLHAVPQPLSYHNFADHRPWLGIPNFGDVVSNLPFAIIGLWGLAFIGSLKPEQLSHHFADQAERWPTQ